MKNQSQITATKHTSTPWAWCNNNTCLYGNAHPEQNTQDCILHCESHNAPDEVNAAYIVHCVNNHETLLSACKSVLVAIEGAEDQLERQLRQAITEAESPESDIEQARRQVG